MSITEEASHAWSNGKGFGDNPHTLLSLSWCCWAIEWGRLEDERNDQIASDDAVTVWNRTVKD